MLANVLKHTVIRSPRRATPSLSHFCNSATVQHRVKAKGPLAHSFSSIDFGVLHDQLKIIPSGFLVEQGNHVDRAAKSIAQDDGTYMTSKEMYRHLNMLANLVSNADQNKAGAHLWIETILFRVSAILSGSNKSMMLNTKLHVPSIGISVPGQSHSLKFSGTIDFAAFITDALSHSHESLLERSEIRDVKLENLKGSFFVTEAKQEEVLLFDHVPQAVAEIYTSAKDLNKQILRGAVTNGYEWVFVIFYLDKDGVGGTYKTSPTITIQVNNNYPYHVLSSGPDIVAGIVAYWMEHSFVDLDENDWFSTRFFK